MTSIEIKKQFSELLTPTNKDAELKIKEQVLAMKFLGEIDEEMEKRNIRKKELATKVGTSASYITQLFRGNRMPNFNIIAKMAAALEIEFVVTTKIKHEMHKERRDADGLWVFKPFKHNINTVKYEQAPKLEEREFAA